MGDHTAGMTLAAAVCAALVARGANGERAVGQHLAVPAGRVHRQLRPQHLPDDGAFHRDRPARDDGQPVHEQLHGGRRAAVLDRRACRAIVIGLRCAAPSNGPNGSRDPRFATGRSRAANAVELIGELDAIFATKPLDEWAKVFASRAGFLLGADQLHRGRRGRRAVPRGGRRSLCARRTTLACPWWRRLPIFTARRGSRARPRRDSANTPRRSSPNSETDLYRLRQILSRCRMTVETGPLRQLHAGGDGHDAPSGDEVSR